MELGPGRGLLAVDLLDGLERHAPAALAALEELILVEVSSSLAARQQERLAYWSGDLAPPLPPWENWEREVLN